MFDNLFLMLGPTTLALVLAPFLVGIGLFAATPRCELQNLRAGRQLAR